MRREIRKKLLHRLGQLLDSDLDTEGFWEEAGVTDAEFEEARRFLLNEADKFFLRANAIKDKKGT